jgi:transcriptional regulator with XRE-family HTH domain
MSHSGDRHSRRGPEGQATSDDFHAEVRRLRRASGLSREELATLTGYSRQYLSQMEQPSRGIPPRPVVEAVDTALRADGTLVALRDKAAAAKSRRPAVARDPREESRRRVHDLLHNRRCDADLDHLDQMVGELIAMADALNPRDVSARVLEQQAFVDGMLRSSMLPHQQFRLYMIAGHLAGLLAIAQLDLGDLATANTCCLEAAVFTELTGHEGLRAWTLAVNRLVDEAARHAELVAGRMEAVAPRSAAELTVVDEAAPGYLSTTGLPEPPGDPIVRRADEVASGRVAAQERPTAEAEPTSPPWRGLADLLTAPGGRASTPRLVALVKGRIARFAASSTGGVQRGLPPSCISRAFQPPV